jgi:hypothetical protein
MAGQFRPGDVVSRRKGLVMHKGIALGNGCVLHNTPLKGEHISSEADFRAGKRMYATRLEPAARLRALRTADRVERRGYHLWKNNCEHTVTRATTGQARSPQLRSWVVGAGFAAATFALTRHPLAAAAAYALGRKVSGHVSDRLKR